MLQRVFPTRSEDYDLKNFFRSLIQAGMWWSHLNYSRRLYEGN